MEIPTPIPAWAAVDKPEDWVWAELLVPGKLGFGGSAELDVAIVVPVVPVVPVLSVLLGLVTASGGVGAATSNSDVVGTTTNWLLLTSHVAHIWGREGTSANIPIPVSQQSSVLSQQKNVSGHNGSKLSQAVSPRIFPSATISGGISKAMLGGGATADES